ELIIAGAGTTALELIEDAGVVHTLVTPVGGGGLISGCATIAKALGVTRLVDEIVTVTDEQIVEAMRFAFERLKLVLEPSGAVGIAAFLNGLVEAPSV